MSEMVERVARAMLAADQAEGHADSECTYISYLKAARAAIESMRQPTEEMMEAIDCGGIKATWLSGVAWLTGYTRMIDAALNTSSHEAAQDRNR